METNEFDEIFSMLSREAILAILAFGDMEDALKREGTNWEFIMEIQAFYMYMLIFQHEKCTEWYDGPIIKKP